MWKNILDNLFENAAFFGRKPIPPERIIDAKSNF